MNEIDLVICFFAMFWHREFARFERIDVLMYFFVEYGHLEFAGFIKWV